MKSFEGNIKKAASKKKGYHGRTLSKELKPHVSDEVKYGGRSTLKAKDLDFKFGATNLDTSGSGL